MKRLAVALLLAVVCGASAATPVRVTLVGKPPTLTAGQAWTARLAVRPASVRAPVLVIATGPRRIQARAVGGRGIYLARLVFPVAGRWTLTVRVAGFTSRLGSVQVRPAGPPPVTFAQPTTIELDPGGTLLVAENGRDRVVRVDPAAGAVTVVASVSKPFGLARAPGGDVYVSSDNLLRRIDSSGAVATVAEAASDVGPITVAPDGDVYFTTATRIFRLDGGRAPARVIAGTGVEGGSGDGGPATRASVSAPHGLAIAADGTLLVADTGNDRIRRIDPASGVIAALAQVGIPDGIDVGRDGTIYVAEARTRRVVHLGATGTRIGFVGPAFSNPVDVAVAADGTTYVLEAGAAGRVRRVAPNGTVTTVSRP